MRLLEQDFRRDGWVLAGRWFLPGELVWITKRHGVRAGLRAWWSTSRLIRRTVEYWSLRDLADLLVTRERFGR